MLKLRSHITVFREIHGIVYFANSVTYPLGLVTRAGIGNIYKLPFDTLLAVAKFLWCAFRLVGEVFDCYASQ